MKHSWRKRGRRQLVDAGRGAIVRTLQQADTRLGVELLEERHLLSAVPFGAELQVSGRAAAAAMAGDGSFVIVSESDSKIFAQRYEADGTPLDIASQLNQSTLPVNDAAMAMNASGEFVVAWTRARPGLVGGDVIARQFAADGTPLGDEFTVNTSPSDAAFTAEVDVNDAGQFVVAWKVDIGFIRHVAARAFSSDGIPQGDDVFVGAIEGTRPDVVLNSDGSFFVIGKSGASIQGFRFDANAEPIGSPILLSSVYPSAHAVADNGDGQFVLVTYEVALDERLGPGNAAVSRRFDAAGSALGGAVNISGRLQTISNYPAVAMSSAGDFSVIWSANQSSQTIYGRQYRADDTPVGGATIINVTAPVSVGAIAMGDDWSAVATYSSRARRLSPETPPKLVAATSQSLTPLPNGAEYPYLVRYFVFSFDKDMDVTGGATGEHSTLNPANWELTANGSNANVLISGIEWAPSTLQAKVSLSSILIDGQFSITLSANVRDVEGHALDTNGDGVAGDGYFVDFTVPPLAAVKETQVNTWIPFDQKAAQIIQDNSGNYVVTYNGGSMLQRFNAAGEPLGKEYWLTKDDLYPYNGVNTNFAMAPDGRFAAVWQGNSAGQPFNYLQLVRFSADGEVLPNDQPELDAFAGRYATHHHVLAGPHYYPREYPDLGIDADGNMLVTWWGKISETEYAIQAQRLDPDGQEVGPSFIVARTNSTLRKPLMEMQSNGTAILIVPDNDSFQSAKAILGYVIDRDNAVSSLPLGITGTLTAFSIAPSGLFAVGYVAPGGTTATFRRIQRFDLAGTAVGSAITGFSSPIMAIDKQGNITVASSVTETGTGNQTGVQVQRYTAANVLREPAFKANTYLPGIQSPKGVLLQPNGNFVVVWDSNGQDGDGYGVFFEQFVDTQIMTGGSVATDADSDLVEGEVTLSQINELRVFFSRGPSTEDGSSGPNSATNPANWQLLENGIDITGSIGSISVDGGAMVLKFDKPLRGASYQLTVRDAIHDTLGRALDGDGDGEPGGDFVRNFGVHQGIFGVGVPMTVNDRNTDTVNWPLVLAYVMPDGAFDVGWDGAYYTAQFRAGVVRRFDATGAPIGGSFPVISRGLTALAEDLFGNIVVGAQFYPQPLISWVIKTDQFGQSIGSERLRSEDAFDYGSEVVIAMDPDGNFLAVWEDGYGLHGQRFDQYFQKVGGILQLGLPYEGDIIPGAVAANSAGEFVVAWRRDGTVNVQKYDSQGNPLTAVIAFSADFNSAPNVAIDEAGEFVVVYNGSGNAAYSRRFNASGQPIGDPQRISNASIDEAFPRVAMAGDGRTMVIWLERVSSVERYMAIELDAATGEKVGSPFLIAEVPATGDFLPNIAANAAGDILVTWRATTDGSTSNVFARRLSFDRGAVVDLNGPAAGVDFATNLVEGGPAPLSNFQWMYVSDAAVNNLHSASLTIEGYEPGDLVTVDATGTDIVANFSDGVLTLTGLDTVAHYEQVLKTATFASSVERPLGSEIVVTFVVNDGFYESAPAEATITYALPVPPSVVGRHIFYNESAFDGNIVDVQPIAAGAYNDDSDAIDFTKSAYLPGSGPATFANITSYDKGINGIIIDLAAGGDHELITADDFVFKVGNNNSPGLWADAPAPTAVSVIPAGGEELSDRIVITWATGAIRNTWLEVQVLANERTGLGVPDVFYWGNAVGGSGLGDTAIGAPTNATDQLAARNNPRGASNLAPVQYPYDYNKDRSVNATDELIARNNGTGFLTQLIKINLGATASLASPVGDTGIASALASSLTVTPRIATPAIGAAPPYSATRVPVEHREPLTLMVATRAVDRALAQHEPEAVWLGVADELVAELVVHLRAE